ncbi:MAG: P-loop containing nucleoside triphosphate hydrolase protein [Linnemannia elongata]|nr:MAG: P-loop containing nucleoside triphosphate hydrolase protein [Linnemannia elongata]
MTYPRNYQQFQANYDDAIDSFDDMGLSTGLRVTLSSKEIDTPTQVQQRTILPILQGRNVILKAQSGSGRMAAFVIAALQKVDPNTHECQVLILTAERRAAVDVWRLLRDLGGPLGVVCRTCLDCDGAVGEEGDDEVGRFVGGSETSATPHVIVGTPSRALHHIMTGDLKSGSVNLLMVVDLDTLLHKQLGYPLECIFNTLTPSSSRSDPKLQVALYFDLQTPELLHTTTQLTHRRQHSNETDEEARVVKIFVRKAPINLLHVRHFYLDVDREDWKLETLCDLYDTLVVPQMVVFCNTREKLDWLAHALRSQTSPLYINNTIINHETDVASRVGCMHADLSPIDRARVMKSFRQGDIRILLLATPLTRSDLDVSQLSLVVGYDLPQDQEVYLRRCGVNLSAFYYRPRLVYISFVKGQEEMRLLRDIEAGIGDTISEMPMNVADYL